jgi:hypothetical protein
MAALVKRHDLRGSYVSHFTGRTRRRRQMIGQTAS